MNATETVDAFVGKFGHAYDDTGQVDWQFEITGIGTCGGEPGFLKLRTIAGNVGSDSGGIVHVKRDHFSKHCAAGGIDLFASLAEMQHADPKKPAADDEFDVEFEEDNDDESDRLDDEARRRIEEADDKRQE